MFLLLQGHRGQHSGVWPLKASFQMQPTKSQISNVGSLGRGEYGHFRRPHVLLLRLPASPTKPALLSGLEAGL